ncbi:MAG TPA: PadR family transcriptional regulator, partial [Pseudonocardiaceae bacterium]|nr:PadR family transcriptional regulator [Pseudonocardiaceae bacterium]
MQDPFNQRGRRHGSRESRRAHPEHMHMRGGPFGPPDGPDFPPTPPGFGPGFGGPGGRGGFGPGFPFGFGGPRGRGRGRGHRQGPGRARRGNVRSAVLILLAERPMHGYEMIQEISERSGGWWRPSPGSVYPTL